MRNRIIWLALTFTIGFVFMFVYDSVWTLRPGKVAIIQKANGEIYVEKQVGYHWNAFDKVVLIDRYIITEAGRETNPTLELYEGKTTVGEAHDLESPNKNLMRIK